MFPSDSELLTMYADVLGNAAVRKIGGWRCENDDAPADDDAYVAKAKADLDAFSRAIDDVLPLIKP